MQKNGPVGMAIMNRDLNTWEWDSLRGRDTTDAGPHRVDLLVPNPGSRNMETREPGSKLGRVAAWILVLFLILSVLGSVVVNVRYGHVTGQLMQAAVSLDAAAQVRAPANSL